MLQDAARASDGLLVVGSELGDSDLWGGRIESDTVIRCDIDPAQLDKNCPADVHLHGDAGACLEALLREALLRELPPGGAPSQGHDRAAALRQACAAAAMVDGKVWAELNGVLRSALPADTIVAGDSSQVTYFGTVHFFPVPEPSVDLSFTSARQGGGPAGPTVKDSRLPIALACGEQTVLTFLWVPPSLGGGTYDLTATVSTAIPGDNPADNTGTVTVNVR